MYYDTYQAMDYLSCYLPEKKKLTGVLFIAA